MTALFFILLVGFEFKHFVADYLLQTVWMIQGKGDLRSGGGYAHAGIHALGSLLVLVATGVPILATALLVGAEFVIHYLLDFAKASYGRGVDPNRQVQLFWAQHGFDQFLHHLTYAAMVYVALRSLGIA